MVFQVCLLYGANYVIYLVLVDVFDVPAQRAWVSSPSITNPWTLDPSPPVHSLPPLRLGLFFQPCVFGFIAFGIHNESLDPPPPLSLRLPSASPSRNMVPTMCFWLYVASGTAVCFSGDVSNAWWSPSPLTWLPLSRAVQRATARHSSSSRWSSLALGRRLASPSL